MSEWLVIKGAAFYLLNISQGREYYSIHSMPEWLVIKGVTYSLPNISQGREVLLNTLNALMACNKRSGILFAQYKPGEGVLLNTINA